MWNSIVAAWDMLYRAIAYAVCHPGHLVQPMLGNNPFPLCYRETGIFLGLLAGGLVLALTHRDRPTELPPTPILVLLGIFVTAMGVDGLSSYAGLRQGNDAVRLATGLMSGFAASALLYPLMNAQLWRRSSPGRVLGTRRQVSLWLAALPASFLVIWFHPLYIGYLLPHLAVGTVVGLIGLINIMLVTAVLPRLEGALEHWGQLALLAAPAGAIALVELGIMFTAHRFMHAAV